MFLRSLALSGCRRGVMMLGALMTAASSAHSERLSCLRDFPNRYSAAAFTPRIGN